MFVTLLVVLLIFFVGRLTRVYQTEPLTGLGDVVALITATLFISATGNCGCKQRRERWNRKYALPRWLLLRQKDRDEAAIPEWLR